MTFFTYFLLLPFTLLSACSGHEKTQLNLSWVFSYPVVG